MLASRTLSAAGTMTNGGVLAAVFEQFVSVSVLETAGLSF